MGCFAFSAMFHSATEILPLRSLSIVHASPDFQLPPQGPQFLGR